MSELKEIIERVNQLPKFQVRADCETLIRRIKELTEQTRIDAALHRGVESDCESYRRTASRMAERVAIAEMQLEGVRGLPERWRETSRRKTQDYTDLCGAADELEAVVGNVILDIPYDRIDGGELDLYGNGEPRTAEQILKEIHKLHVYKPAEIAARVNEGWVSMPDFVSVNEIRAISKIIALEVDHD